MTREELKAKIREKKIRRAFKIMRFRSLKNFFIWLTGAMMSFVIFFLTVFVAVGVVPIGTYTGGESDEVVGEAISDKSLYQAIMDFNTYKIGDIPALSNALTQIINESGLDQYVSIDVDKLNNIKFVYDDDSTDMMTELTSCIKVTASIETVMSATDGSSGLGDFGNLSVFSSYGEIAEYVKAKVKTDDNGLVNDDPENPLNAEDYYYFDDASATYLRAFNTSGNWAGDVKRDVLYVKNKDLPQVDTNGDITKNAEGEFNSNPKLYYYDANSVEDAEGGANPMADEVKEPKWERAFDDNGKRVAPLNVKLHYANLSKVPILEAIDLIDESLGRLELTELLDVFAEEDTAGSNNLIGSILGDKTISDIMTLSFEDFTLTTFLPYVEYKEDGTTIKTDNRELYKILLQATGKELTKEVDGKKVDLTDDEIKALADDMSLGELEFKIDNIALGIIMKDKDNEILNMLVDMVNEKLEAEADGEEFTAVTVDTLNVGHIQSLDTSYIKLTSFMPYYEKDNEGNEKDNKELYKILLQALGNDLTIEENGEKRDLSDDEIKPFAEDLSLSDLSNKKFMISNVKLSTVMTADKKLQGILSGALNGKPYADITIADLGGSAFNIDNVKLSTVLTSPDNSLKSILEDVYVGHTIDVGDKQVLVNSYEDITLSMLASFKMEDLHLYKVLPAPSGNLKSILEDAFDDNYEGITVSMLSGDGFNFDKVSLKTVVGETSSNPIIQALIESGSSVGGIGDAINELSLYKVYGANIFTTTPVANSPRYTLSADGKTYTLKDDGEYYLSEDAGIWLLICFDSSTTLSSDEINHKGRPISYTISSATIADLQGGNENSVDISSAFTHATVRQLIDAGIIESANALLYDKTLEQALNATLGGFGG